MPKALCLLLAPRIAAIAMMLTPTPETVMAATQTQSSPSSALSEAVVSASRSHKKLFIINTAWIVVAGLVTVWLSWRVWKAGNREQDAIRRVGDERLGIVERANIEAQSDLEKERTARLELENSIAPRLIPLRANLKAGTSNLDELKPFAPTKVIVKFLPDAEASRAASNIVDILEAVGWKVERVDPKPDANANHFDGVVIEMHLATPRPGEAPGAPPTWPTAEESRTRDAATALSTFLTKNNWVSNTRPVFDDDELPRDTIRVTVGFKPAPYFAPKGDSGVVIWGNTGGMKIKVRRIDDTRGIKLLKRAPKATVKIAYVSGSRGAKELAEEMRDFFKTHIPWSVSGPEESNESSVEGILIELSAEGWADKTPVAPLPQDARALERFLSECIPGNSRIALTAKNSNNEPVYMTAATAGASPEPSLNESNMQNVKGEIRVVIGPQN